MTKGENKEVGQVIETAEEIVAKANLLIQQQNEERIARVNEGINKLLQEYNCVLDVSVLITAQGNKPMINILPQ